MIDKPTSAISMVDIEDLIANAVRESKTLEYKSRLACSTRDERKEFLADITAMANTAGGDLLIGVEERAGEAIALPGLEITDWDALERMLSSVIRDGTEPRLTGIEFARVAVSDGKYVLVIRVARSYRRPHRVIIGGHGHFYGRDSAQKYQLDVENLRRAFALVEATSEALDRFRSERTSAISQDAGFAPIPGPPRLIMHLIGEESAHGDREIDLTAATPDLLRPLPRGPLGFSDRVNHLGAYCVNEQAYTAVFRKGIVEAVETIHTHREMLFPTPLQQEVIDGVALYLRLLQAVDIEPPIHILITLEGVAGYSFPAWGIESLIRPRGPFPEAVLTLRKLTLDNYDVEVAGLLRPAFDHLWNAFGYQRCLDYDETGAWQPRTRSIVS